MPSGRLSPSTASTLVAAFAKTIELSFVACFIAYLGQYLSRKALSSHRKGMTISDMQLRTLILQPGALFLHFEAFVGTWRTWIGGLSAWACIVAIFYTTASDALVSPKLRMRNPVMRDLTSEIRADFADILYLQNRCPSPINDTMDYNAGRICSELEHSGEAYHNFMYVARSEFLAACSNRRLGSTLLSTTQAS